MVLEVTLQAYPLMSVALVTVTLTNCAQNPEPYYVDVYIDGVQVLFQGPITISNFNYTITEADIASSGVSYTQNSVVEVYILPNTFYTIDPLTGLPLVYTTYIPEVIAQHFERAVVNGHN